MKLQLFSEMMMEELWQHPVKKNLYGFLQPVTVSQFYAVVVV